MSDYCQCCPTNTEYIRQHYDVDGLVEPDENPEEVLKIFQGCCETDEPCRLDLKDVIEYQEAIAADRAEKAARLAG